jgi:hypothetical protein
MKVIYIFMDVPDSINISRNVPQPVPQPLENYLLIYGRPATLGVSAGNGVGRGAPNLIREANLLLSFGLIGV